MTDDNTEPSMDEYAAQRVAALSGRPVVPAAAPVAEGATPVSDVPEVIPPVVEPEDQPAEPVIAAVTDPEPAKTEPPAEPPKPLPGVHGAREAEQQRVARLAEAVEKLVPVLEKIGTAVPATEETPKPPEDPRPMREAFADPESYDSALVEWAGRQAGRAATAAAEAAAEQKIAEQRAADEAKASEQRQAEQIKAIADDWTAKQDKFITEHPDYREVTERDDLPVSYAMVHAMTQSENGPALAYYLGKNPQEAARIAAIADPLRVAIEIGRIEGKLTAPAAAAAEPVTRTPDPPRTIRASNQGATARDPNDESMEEYAARRNPQIAAEHRPFVFGRVSTTTH